MDDEITNLRLPHKRIAIAPALGARWAPQAGTEFPPRSAMAVDSRVCVLDPNLSARCPRELRNVTTPQLFHDVEASVAKQSKCPGRLASRKLIRAERSAKHPARSKADDRLGRVSPVAFKKVVESRRTKCMDLSLFQRRNCFLNVLARDLGALKFSPISSSYVSRKRTPPVPRSSVPAIHARTLTGMT